MFMNQYNHYESNDVKNYELYVYLLKYSRFILKCLLQIIEQIKCRVLLAFRLFYEPFRSHRKGFIIFAQRLIFNVSELYMYL